MKSEYGAKVATMAVQLGLDKDLSLPADASTWTAAQLGRLSNHVENLAHETIPSGLYTWGRGYTPETLASTVRLMAQDPVAYALARLDLEGGRVSQIQVDDAVFFDRRYRERAKWMVARVQAGTPPDQIVAEVVDRARVAEARAWRDRSRRRSDESII